MTTTDALKKLKDKLSKAETENDKTKDKYRDRLVVENSLEIFTNILH